MIYLQNKKRIVRPGFDKTFILAFQLNTPLQNSKSGCFHRKAYFRTWLLEQFTVRVVTF